LWFKINSDNYSITFPNPPYKPLFNTKDFSTWEVCPVVPANRDESYQAFSFSVVYGSSTPDMYEDKASDILGVTIFDENDSSDTCKLLPKQLDFQPGELWQAYPILYAHQTPTST